MGKKRNYGYAPDKIPRRTTRNYLRCTALRGARRDHRLRRRNVEGADPFSSGFSTERGAGRKKKKTKPLATRPIRLPCPFARLSILRSYEVKINLFYFLYAVREGERDKGAMERETIFLCAQSDRFRFEEEGRLISPCAKIHSLSAS